MNKNTLKIKTWIGILALVISFCFCTAGPSYSKEVRKYSKPSLHIDAMEGTLESNGNGAMGRVLVTITNDNGEPVADVQVKGKWGGLVRGHSFGITNEDGTVIFVSRSTVESGFITFQVKNVGVSGYKYDPSKNKVDNVQIFTADDTNLAPEAIISADFLSSPAPFNITLCGWNSYDQDGYIVAYEWDLEDGTHLEAPAIGHCFTEPGDYKAILTVTDDQGKKTSDEIIINVTVSGADS